jgi:chromosome segregation ATPase
MSEEETKKLSAERSFEKRLFGELAVQGELLKGVALRMSGFENRWTSFEDRIIGLFEQVDARFEQVDARFEQVEARLTSVEAKITSFDGRLTSLEEKVDARLKETRPIWEAVQNSVQLLDKKFDLMIKDLYDLRGNFGMHESWLRELDRRVNP